MEAVVLFFVPLLLLVTGCVSPGASPAATQEAAAVPTLEAGATSVPATPEPMTTSAQLEIPAPGLTPIAEPLSPEPDTSTLALIAAATKKPITFIYPRFIYKHIPSDDLTTTEQELIMQFRQIQLEELERIAIILVKELAKFDPYEALENIVDITKEKADIREELKKYIAKRKGQK